MVRFGNKDLARYPFLREALSYVTEYDFRLEDLDNSEFHHLVKKAETKIEQYVFRGKLEYQIDYNKTHDIIVQEEVIIFLISLTSLYLMCLSSGLGCTVIPSAPNRWISIAALTTSGLFPPRELRSVAILLMFTESFVITPEFYFYNSCQV